MKICFTFVKDFKKPNAFMIRQDFVRSLIDLGLPEEVAELMAHQDIVTWKNYDVDHDATFAAEIICDHEA